MTAAVRYGLRRPPEGWRVGGTPGPRLRRAWSLSDAEPVRITGADVVRVTEGLFAAAWGLLEERGVVVGPVLLAVPRGVVEVVVPPGTAGVWPQLRGTVCVRRGVLRCPHPAVTPLAGAAVRGRTWLVPPRPGDSLVTDPDALAEALGAALYRRARRKEEYGMTFRQPAGSRIHDLQLWPDEHREAHPGEEAGGETRARVQESVLGAWGYTGAAWLLGRDTDSVGLARRYVRDALEVWGVGSEARDALMLAASEFVTNAVVHARVGLVRMELVRVCDGRVGLLVADEGPRPVSGAYGGDVLPDNDTEGGRGLFLVRSLTDEFEVTPRGSGTLVAAWVRCPVPHAPTCPSEVPGPGVPAPREANGDAPRPHPE